MQRDQWDILQYVLHHTVPFTRIAFSTSAPLIACRFSKQLMSEPGEIQIPRESRNDFVRQTLKRLEAVGEIIRTGRGGARTCSGVRDRKEKRLEVGQPAGYEVF